MDDIVEKVAQSPAIAVETVVDTTKQLTKSIEKQAPIKSARKYWKTLGPGLTTGAADDDPSGIATYSQTGASSGFQLLWLSAFTFPLMAVVQEMCARIGMVTGQGLAANIRLHYPRWLLFTCATLLFLANSLNIGANLGAMAKASQLIVPELGFTFLVLGFVLISLVLQLFFSYKQFAQYLKFLVLFLFSYIITIFVIPNLDWTAIFRGAIIPSITFSQDQIFLICAILGTTISPYLFFWQTSQEVEEEILQGKVTIKQRQDVSHQHIKKMRLDVWSGMFLSNLVMFFIIATTGATLFANGTTEITTAADAAAALRPLAGEYAYLLFAAGIIGTGLLAVPVLAGSASYAISESFKWTSGLNHNLKGAYAFYGVIIISMIVGFAINFTGIDPIKILIYSAVFNALVAPLVLFFIVSLSSNEKVMGSRKNNYLVTILGWFITGVMALVGIAAVVTLFI